MIVTRLYVPEPAEALEAAALSGGRVTLAGQGAQPVTVALLAADTQSTVITH